MDSFPFDRRHQMPCDPLFIFYDGHCATCHRVVRFLLQSSRRTRFRFVALQSLKGGPLERRIAEDLSLDLTSSLVIWKNGSLLSQAPAIFGILSELGWPWTFLLLLRLIPIQVTNFFYRSFARNRYRLFGAAKYPDLCDLVPPAHRHLFLLNFPDHFPIFPPRPKVFLSAQWKRLVLINYAVPAACLQEFVPAGVELDTWQGETLVSLVGFAFVGTSLASMTLPVCADFEEINLRFYVRRSIILNGQTVWQRGVVFIKEIVPFPIIALTANLFYGERYEAHQMNHATRKQNGGLLVSYSWADKGGTYSLSIAVQGDSQPLRAGSLSEFITEHYYGYSKSGQERTIEYEVEHPRWRVWEAGQARLEGAYEKFYPPSITKHMKVMHSALLAEGSPVRVMRGTAVRTLFRG